MLSWSSGKDSAFALHVAQISGELEVVGLLTTITESYDRVAIHGVRSELLDRQVKEIGLPIIKVGLPCPCTNAIYEAKIKSAYGRVKGSDISQIAFGDLFLENLRAYREEKLGHIGMRAVFPLWKRDTALPAREIISAGIVAYITCINLCRLDRTFAGRRFDETFLTDLPSDVDPCGENGEFHTVVTAGPMFASDIPVSVGAIVEREGLIFADVIPT